jgi:hypothetical protein
MSAPLELIKSWVELVTNLKVIYDGDPEPSAPSPKVEDGVFTYAAINFLSDGSGYGTTYESTSDEVATQDPDKVNQYRSKTRIADLDIALYGQGAADYCRALDLSLGRPDVIELLEDAGDFAIDKPTEVDEEPIIRSATRDPDAAIQFVVQWVDSEIYETEAVETFEVDATVTEES